MTEILNGIQSLGALGPAAFILIYILGTLLFIPMPVLMLAAGALFGVPLGFALVSLSATLSAGGVFLAGRYFSRGWILKKIEAHERIRMLDDAVSKEGWKMVLLLRLAATLPFSLLNYILGLSKISFKHYILTSWIGMMPGMLLYVYLGFFAGKMVFDSNSRQKTALEWAFFVLGFVATLAITVYGAFVAKRALRTKKVLFLEEKP